MKWLRLLPVLAVVFLAGCPKSKIHEKKTYDMEGGTSRELVIEAPSGEQKIKVAFTSTAGPVSVYVLQEDKLGDKKDDIDEDKLPAAAVLGKEKGKDGSINVTVPAKKGYRIVIYTDKKTTVTVNVDTV